LDSSLNIDTAARSKRGIGVDLFGLNLKLCFDFDLIKTDA